MGIRFVCGTRKLGEINDEAEITADELEVVGIDDLAKFRIVQFLCETPEICGDAMLYAEQLGLRPVERTTGLLEELVERQILERNGLNGLPVYKLTSDKGMRYRLICLLEMARSSISQAQILTRLATRSLDRVKLRKSKKKHKQEPATELTNVAALKLTLCSPVPVLAEARVRRIM